MVLPNCVHWTDGGHLLSVTSIRCSSDGMINPIGSRDEPRRVFQTCDTMNNGVPCLARGRNQICCLRSPRPTAGSGRGISTSTRGLQCGSSPTPKPIDRYPGQSLPAVVPITPRSLVACMETTKSSATRIHHACRRCGALLLSHSGDRGSIHRRSVVPASQRAEIW